MALRQPIALENASSTERPNADEFRLMLQHLIGDAATSSLASAGVVGATALKVTEKSGTPNMSVDIAAGWVFIEGTEASPSGLYAVYNDATANIAAAAADATNPRKDLVICRVRDSQYSGASDDAELVYVAGTPAASPVEPDLDALGYENYAVLALVDVPALDTSITNSQITDRRTASLAWTRGRGEIAYAQSTSNQAGISSMVDLTGVSVTFTGEAGRKLKTTVSVEVSPTNADTRWDLTIADGASTTLRRTVGNSSVAGSTTTTATYREVLSSGGSITRTGRLAVITGGGTLTAAGATAPSFILVEDIGGSLL